MASPISIANREVRRALEIAGLRPALAEHVAGSSQDEPTYMGFYHCRHFFVHSADETRPFYRAFWVDIEGRQSSPELAFYGTAPAEAVFKAVDMVRDNAGMLAEGLRLLAVYESRLAQGQGGLMTKITPISERALDGKALPLSAFIFGNECGEQIKAVRTAWRATCARAGIAGLHFHDLRREFGSRVLESGSSLVEARDLLGHANISQTSTYLQSTAKSLGLAIERKEAHEREQAARRARQAQQAQETSEKDCHTMADCDNEQAAVTLATQSAQVTKH